RDAAPGGRDVVAHRTSHQGHRPGGTDSAAGVGMVSVDGAVDHLERAQSPDPAAQVRRYELAPVHDGLVVVADDGVLDTQGTRARYPSAHACGNAPSFKGEGVAAGYDAIGHHERTAVPDVPTVGREATHQGDS